jgi:hypothetical protein
MDTLRATTLANLKTAEALELDELPVVGGCATCEGYRQRPSKVMPKSKDVIVQPVPGRLRKTGPLYHGLHTRSGERLPE